MSNIKYLKLRFPEFTGEWEVRKLGELIKVNMCKRIFSNQTASIGEVPFYKIGTLGDKADSYISRELFEEYKDKYNYPRKGEILITCSGTVGKTVIYDGRDSYYQDSNIVWLNNDNKIICNSIIKIIISRIDWNRKLNSTTITRLYNDDIRSLIIEFPTEKEEQQKIGDFFMLLDKRIEQQEQKIALLKDYKKAMMQKIFSQKIRFKDDNGNDYPDWEEKKLGKICRVKSSQLTNNVVEEIGKYPVYGANSIVGYTENYEVNKYVSIVKDGAGVGRIAFINNKSSVLGTLQYLIGIEITTEFLYVLLSNVNFKLYQTGTTIPHIYFKDYSKMIIDIPCQLEQEKISSFLFAMDLNLENQEVVLNNFKEQKQGLLRKMFV